MNKVGQYILLWLFLAKISLIADMEYRLNFLGKIFADFVWYAAQLSLFEVIFRHTSLVGGWTLSELRVFMGVLFLVDALYMVLCHENLELFSSKIVKGELDLILAKPVNSQFMMSFGRVNSPYLINVCLIGLYLSWALTHLEHFPNVWRVFACLIASGCGFIVLFSIRFMFASVSAIFVKSDALSQIWYQLYKLATRPDVIYPSWIRILIFTILPIGFISSIPSRLILDKVHLGVVFVSIAVAAGSLWLTSKWWTFVLSKYSSASS